MSTDTPVQPKIRIDSVHKSYVIDGRQQEVLAGVDLTVNEGEFVSIIGPSGCGKSTLLNIIAGLDQPDSGNIELSSENSDKHSGTASGRLGRTGYMQQKDLLLPWRSVLDNTILGLELRGVPRKQAREQAMEFTEAFGLQGFEHHYPYALSGGMRQRAAFLRTMLMGQDVVLLDEPFGALDALTRVQMQEWLLQLWESMNKTIVLITHDVDEALLLSDRVYLLTARPGRVTLVLDVDLPRPRHYDLVTSPEFGVLKARLMEPLRSQIQSIQSAGRSTGQTA
ncbi:MAG: ABC transporter ATP-binding protein [Chloroflexi bacterium]|nr:ABC transporter ATP-binding protein [Chloroflexota bacterium]